MKFFEFLTIIKSIIKKVHKITDDFKFVLMDYILNNDENYKLFGDEEYSEIINFLDSYIYAYIYPCYNSSEYKNECKTFNFENHKIKLYLQNMMDCIDNNKNLTEHQKYYINNTIQSKMIKIKYTYNIYNGQ